MYSHSSWPFLGLKTACILFFLLFMMSRWQLLIPISFLFAFLFPFSFVPLFLFWNRIWWFNSVPCPCNITTRFEFMFMFMSRAIHLCTCVHEPNDGISAVMVWWRKARPLPGWYGAYGFWLDFLPSIASLQLMASWLGVWYDLCDDSGVRHQFYSPCWSLFYFTPFTLGSFFSCENDVPCIESWGLNSCYYLISYSPFVVLLSEWWCLTWMAKW